MARDDDGSLAGDKGSGGTARAVLTLAGILAVLGALLAVIVTLLVVAWSGDERTDDGKGPLQHRCTGGVEQVDRFGLWRIDLARTGLGRLLFFHGRFVGRSLFGGR